MVERPEDPTDDDQRERLSMPGRESELVDQLEEEAADESPRDETVPEQERNDAAGSAGVVDSVPGSGEPPD